MNLWVQGAQEAIPLPETPAARFELLRRTVPFFPWLPLVPAAVLLGTALTALALAARANRKADRLEACLQRDEAHEALHRQPLEPISP